MSTRGRQPKPPAEGRADEEGELWRALEAGLQEILPGLEVLDRDVAFDEGGRADLAAVDGAGRLVLVLLAQDAERTPLEALDALSFARRHADLLAHHFRRGRVASELEPRVLVVAPAADERLTLRLAPLLGAGLELFGVRTLSSRGGERSYLVPLAPPRADAVEGRAGGEEAFLAALPRDVAPFARQVLARVERLDDELSATIVRDSAVWRFRGEILVRVERAGDRLRASVSPHQERLPLDGEEALETLLETALERLVGLLGRGGSGPAPAGPPPGAPERGGEDDEDRPLDEPLLTPEEIQAFRD